MILKILEKGSTKVYAPDDQVADYLFLGFTDTGTTTEVVVTDPSKEIVEMKIEDDIVTAFRYKGDSVWRTVAGGGGTDTYKVKVDGTDTADYLENKLQQGTNVTITKSGGKLVVNSTGGSGEAGVTVYSDLATIKAVDTTAYTDVQTVQVASLGLYKFQPASTLTGDDVNVITPTTGSSAGRWIKQSIDITEQSTTSWGKVKVVTTNNRQLKTTGLTKQKKVVFLGSSVLLGTGASVYANSWAGKLTTALQAETDITFVGFENRGISGNAPSMVRERIINEVCSLNPDIVVIGLCSNNSGLYSQTSEVNAVKVMSVYLEDILQICSILEERGIGYIVTGEYGVSSATAIGTRAKKVINFKLSKLFKNRYMACLGNVANDSDGNWVTEAGSVDGGHPGDAGHKAIYDNVDMYLLREPYSPFYDFCEYNGFCKMGATTGFQGFYLAPLGTSATTYIQDFTCFFDANKGTGANSKVLFKVKRSSSVAGIVIKTDASGYITIYEGTTLKYTSTVQLKTTEMTRICISTNALTLKCKILIDGVAIYSWTLASTLNANIYDLKLGGNGNDATENTEGYGYSNFVLYRGMLDDYSISKCFQGEWFQSNVMFAHNLNLINTLETTLTSQCNQFGGKIVAHLQESGIFVNQSTNIIKYTPSEKQKLATINTVGATVASATTIVAPSTIFHVTGTTAISTITVPYTGFTGQITIIPDGVFTLATGGNIAEAYTAVVGRAIQLIFDGTSWYRVNS